MDRINAIEATPQVSRHWTWLIAVAGVAMIAAAPASAGDEFEDAYKYEMGRIAAHATVGAGLHFLHAAFAPVHYYHEVRHAPPRHHYRHKHDRHRGHGHSKWRQERHPRKHARHKADRHRHDRHGDRYDRHGRRGDRRR